MATVSTLAVIPAHTVGPAIVLAVLASAVLHATWNAIAHGVADRLVGFALIGIASVVCGGAIVLSTGLPRREAWPFILASVALHIAYNLFLLAGYQLGQFSQVYPLARGTSPLVVTLVATTFLGQHLPLPELGGVLIVSLGLIGLVLIGGGSIHAPRKALAAAFVTGIMIAGYTIVDGVGVHRTGALGYTGWLFFLQGPAMPLVAAVRRRGALFTAWGSSAVMGLTGGAVSMIAYGLVLWAQTRGSLAPISALRETSIIVGALIGSVFFGERFGYRRAVASAVIVGGILLISMG